MIDQPEKPKPTAIELKYFHLPMTWEVVTTTNFGGLNPGDHINRDYRDWLYKHLDTVSVIDFDLVSTIENVKNIVPLPVPL